MKLTRLIYASVAPGGMPYSDLMAILRTAEVHNAQCGISGILCYGNGWFLQALEGDRDEINRLYNRIVHDRRHEACTILAYGRIVSRSFDEWTMKLVGLDDAPTARRRSLVMRHSGSAEFMPYQMSGAQATAFLSELADDARRAA